MKAEALHLENYPAVISMWTVCVECPSYFTNNNTFLFRLGRVSSSKWLQHEGTWRHSATVIYLFQWFTVFFLFVCFFQQLNKKSFSNEVNEMGRKLVEKVTHTHTFPNSHDDEQKNKKKKKNPPIQLWKWGFGTFGTSLLRVCLPHPACLCHREKESPNLDAEEEKKTSSSSTLVFLSLWIARGISRFFPWLFLPHFPFVNSICIPFGDRKCLRFWYVCPRGELGGYPAPMNFFLCIHGCIKVSFSLYVYHPGLLFLLSTKKKITNDETKEDRWLSL